MEECEEETKCTVRVWKEGRKSGCNVTRVCGIGKRWTSVSLYESPGSDRLWTGTEWKKVGEVEEDCENNLATYRKRKEMFDLLPPLCVRLSYVDDFIPNSQLRLLISLYAGHWVRYKSVSRASPRLFNWSFRQCFSPPIIQPSILSESARNKGTRRTGTSWSFGHSVSIFIGPSASVENSLQNLLFL